MKKSVIVSTILSIVLLASCVSPGRRTSSDSEPVISSTSIISTVSSTSVPTSQTSSSELPIVPVLEKITLDKTELHFNLNKETLYVSDILTPSFEGKGDFSREIEWRSDNESVVTVDNGLVTAVSVGNSIITVMSTVYENIVATCNVEVIDDTPTVSDVYIDPGSAVIDLKNENSKQFTATVVGSYNPSQICLWSVEGDGAQIDNGLVTVSKKGIFTIKAKSVLDTTKEATAFLIVNDSSAVVTGVIVSPSTTTIDVYPSGSVEKTKQLTARVTGENNPPQDVEWLSSNDKVATVSRSGLVTAVSKGTATITAISTANREKSGKCTVTVKDSTPVVKSISLESTITVHLGKTGQLTATVNGDNLKAEHKLVDWSINDTNIATIDSEGIITAKKLGTATITATSKFDSSVSAKSTLTVDEVPSRDAYTILLYISGSNLESDSGLATQNINAIKSAGSIPSDVNIVIQTGGSTSWSNSTYGSKSNLHRLHVEGSNIVLDSKITRTAMSASSTLQSFIEYGLKNYDADQVGLILWNHGGGISGVCCDDNASDSYDMLNASEIHSAVAGAFSKVGRSSSDKLTWIGYDACLMGVADIATVNSDYFEYMVGSEELENGAGWDYKTWVQKLYSNPNISPQSLLPVLCSSFVSQYGTSSSNDQTLAVYDLSKTNALVSAFNQYAQNIDADNNWSSISSAYRNSLRFGASYGYYTYGVADFQNFLEKLKSQSAVSSVDQTTLKTAISNMIIANSYGNYYKNTLPCGMTLFVPCDNSSSVYRSDYSGSNATKFTTWQTACLNNGSFYGWY